MTQALVALGEIEAVMERESGVGDEEAGGSGQETSFGGESRLGGSLIRTETNINRQERA